MHRSMVLIHGAWLASNSWENFDEYFSRAGYDVHAPEWPRKADGVEAQRAAGDDIAGLGVEEVVDHYAKIIGDMPEPPVLVGHSFGGLFVELLLDRGYGVAGVALDPAPPKGVLRLAASELKAGSPALAHPGRRNGVVPLTLEQFTFAFANTFDDADALAAFERYAVPETARVIFEGGLANFAVHPTTKVHYDNPDRAPLLITACEFDNTVPVSVAHSAWRKYRNSDAVTDYHEFPGRPHLLMVGPGWREVADYVATWLDRVLLASPAVTAT